MTARERIGEQVVNLRESLNTLWQATAVIAERVNGLTERVSADIRREAGRDPFRPPVRRAHSAKAAWKRARRIGTSPLRAVVRTVVIRPAQNFLSLTLVLFLVLTFIYFQLPGWMRQGANYITGGVLPASCEPQEIPAGGVVGWAAFIGDSGHSLANGEARKVIDKGPQLMLQGAETVGKALGAAAQSLATGVRPVEYVRPGTAAQVAAQVASCACPGDSLGALPASHSTNEPEGIDAIAQAIVKAGVHGEEAARFVALTGPESGFGTNNVNPTSDARGPWQIRVNVHNVSEEEAHNPETAAAIAVRLKRESPAGFKGPWKATYAKSSSYLPESRLAVQRAEQAVNGMQAVDTACAAPEPAVYTAAAPVKREGQNGRLPASVLGAVPGTKVSLHVGAVPSAVALRNAFEREFGKPLLVTDGYRSLAGQIAVRKAKPTLAAVPGTSVHGWGLAMDLGSGVQTFGSREHSWMVQNAPGFGWILPEWARQNGSKPEAWHWEFVGGKGA